MRRGQWNYEVESTVISTDDYRERVESAFRLLLDPPADLTSAVNPSYAENK